MNDSVQKIEITHNVGNIIGMFLSTYVFFYRRKNFYSPFVFILFLNCYLIILSFSIASLFQNFVKHFHNYIKCWLNNKPRNLNHIEMVVKDLFDVDFHIKKYLDCLDIKTKHLILQEQHGCIFRYTHFQFSLTTIHNLVCHVSY